MNRIKSQITLCQKAIRYTRALARWIKAGRPLRSPEEIREIFTAHCQACESWNADGSSCQCCGCRVNTSTVAALNKIAMKTENCPLEKW